jgi:cyclophilin family peptidyl-prolyl cis-trans isomerase/HEAT repeat protein
MPIQALLVAALCALPVRAEPTLRDRARAQDYSSLPLLRDALQGGDAAARSEAAFALGQLGLVDIPQGSSEPAMGALMRADASEALYPAVSDADAGVRRAAVEALGKVGGPDAEPFLLAAATDADAGVRGEAALALFRRRFLKHVPGYSTAAISRLTMLAGDSEAEVRWRAAYALSQWPEPRVEKAIVAAQSDGDERVRLFAVRALAKIPAAPAAARLADPAVYVRAAAVTAFSAAKAWEKIPDAAFADASAHVRAAAADAAAESGDAARFAPLLLKMIAEPGTLAPGRALIALARLRGGGAALEIARARQDPRWWIRASAYQASAFLPDGAGILRRGVDDADPRVAATALETLASSTASAGDVVNRVLLDPQAPLETLGAAVEAAADRASPEFLPGLLSALGRAKSYKSAELRADLRKALLAVAAKSPDRAGEIAETLKKFPPFVDKPRRFRPLKVVPSVVFETERGSFTIALASAEDAGNHVAAFVDGVKRGLYDGLTWHRVVTAFVVQGGDPRGSGWGDAGWRLADEINRLPFERGTVGMPKAGKDTGGCQLFVTLVPTPRLDGRYTAFGRVVEGMDVLDYLEPDDKIIRARLK